MRSIYDPFASGHLPFPFERRSRRDPQRRSGHPEGPRPEARYRPEAQPARRIPIEPVPGEPRLPLERVAAENQASSRGEKAPRSMPRGASDPALGPVGSAEPHESLRARIPVEQPAEAPSEPSSVAAELAELERVKERLTRESEREVLRRERELLVGFLSVVDDLERAIASAKAVGPADRALMQGIEMVHRRFLDKLAAHGVEREGAVGDTFDPSAHEAIATAPVADPALVGRVTNVVKPGYRMAGELLRPAMVVVGKR